MTGRPSPRLRAAAVLGLLGLALACGAPSRADPVDQPHAVLSPLLGPGEAFTATFALPGQSAYHCHLHPGMTGLLDVQAAPSDSAPRTHVVHILDPRNGSAGRLGFQDAQSGTSTTTLAAGDSVVWINDGNLTHDVAFQARAQAPTDPGWFEPLVAGLALAAVAVIVASRLRKPR